MNFSFNNYDAEGFFDEMFTPEGQVRAGYAHFKDRVENLTKEDFLEKYRKRFKY